MSVSLRKFAGRFALLAFLVGLVAPVSPSAHLVRDVDVDCGPSLQIGLAIQQIAPVGEASGPEHCPACHLQRALGGANPARIASADPGLTLPELVANPIDSRPGRTIEREGPSRAPPARVTA